jgi:hypothetical protein
MRNRAKAGFVLAAILWLWAAPLLGGSGCGGCCCSCGPAETARSTHGAASCGCEISPAGELPATPPAVAPTHDAVPLHAEAPQETTDAAVPAPVRADGAEEGSRPASHPAYILHASLLC